MWKAFEELEQLGWIEPGRRPRMVSVQAAGCAPIVRAFEAGRESAEPWTDARTIASGLRVPGAVADFLMLRALRESGGTAVAVTDEELVASEPGPGAAHGDLPGPGGRRHPRRPAGPQGARLGSAADERVVLFNTGSGYKYLEALS